MNSSKLPQQQQKRIPSAINQQVKHNSDNLRMQNEEQKINQISLKSRQQDSSSDQQIKQQRQASAKPQNPTTKQNSNNNVSDNFQNYTSYNSNQPHELKYDLDYLMSIVNKENENSTQGNQQQKSQYDEHLAMKNELIQEKFKNFHLDDDDYDSNQVLSGTNGIELEVKNISNAEEQLMMRARQLENEMRQIKQAKLDVVIKQFEAQLLKDAQLEEKRFTEELRDKYELQTNQIEAEKESSMQEIARMQKQLMEQIEFFKVVYNELEAKKSELNSTHQACIQYLRREMSASQNQQKDKLMKHICDKKEIFKNYILQSLQQLNPVINDNNTFMNVNPDGRLIRKLKEPLQISLLGKEELATDTYVYRFQLPDLSSTLGHSTCQYLEFEAEILNRETKQKEKYLRYYHPMSKVIDSGYVDLLIKVYLRNFKHPTGGLFTQYMDQIQEGSVLKITGIGGDIQYDGYSNFLIRNQSTKLMEKKTYKNVGMIAGGSGITPMFQLVQTVADLKNDFTSLSLIYSNRTPYDIILDEDLTDYEKAGKLYYFPIVQAPDENWTLGSGRITPQMIESFMPPKNRDDSIILVCGSQILKDEVLSVFKEMDYKNYFIFQ
eukprot:403376702